MGISLTLRVKGPCCPQSVGAGDEELVDEPVVALSAVMELAGVPELEVVKVVNVRTDEVDVDDARVDEVGTTDPVHVSSATDVEFRGLKVTGVVEADTIIDASSYEVAGDTNEDVLVGDSELGK